MSEAGVSDHILRGSQERGRRSTEEWGEWITFMGALNIQNDPREIRGADVIGKSFATAEDATYFFALYAKLTGFSIRKGTKRCRPNGDVKSLTWLCSKEGFRRKKFLKLQNRKKEPKAITRTGCRVRMRVLLSRDSMRWIVREFQSTHNHEVANETESLLLRSHRTVPVGAFQTAKAMHAVGMKICHIIGYLIDQYGGLENTSFLPKDLRNKLGAAENEVTDVDASRAIGYLQHKADMDMGLFAKYTVDNSRRLLNMVWADSTSKLDYATYGHALAFDSTYRTNKYRKPLLIFVGVNNHYRSTVFAFAMLKDESLETYTWVLQTFLECMNGVAPKTVITDGDLAMRQAIRHVFPDAVHRLCSWHIEKKAMTNVKDPLFFSRLQRLMFKKFEEAEFEEEWKKMVVDLGLEENSWLPWLYERKRSWAETYLRGHYFAGMTTTQRNEGVNAALKKKVVPTMPLHQWVRHLDMAVALLRHNELKDNFETKHGSPVVNMTNMASIEKQAAEMYTRRMFFKVRDEIEREGKYLVHTATLEGTSHFISLSKYGSPGQIRNVTYDAAEQTFKCVCNKFDTTGIPCRHVFAVMKYLQITKMPPSLMCKHWLKNVKERHVSAVDTRGSHGEHGDFQGARFGELSTLCSDVAWFGSRNERIFNKAKRKIDDLRSYLRNMFESELVGDDIKDSYDEPQCDVQNPIPSQTKGSASSPSGKSRKKQCGFCKERGHNIQTCLAKRLHHRRHTTDTNVPMEEPLNTQTFQQSQTDQAQFHGTFQSTPLHQQQLNMEEVNGTPPTAYSFGVPYGGGTSTRLWD